MLGPAELTACYTMFILTHGLEIHPNSMKPFIEVIAANYFSSAAFLYGLLFVSLGVPVYLLTFFMPDVKRKGQLNQHYSAMICASAAIYVIDVLQDLLLGHWSPHPRCGRIDRVLKYAVHLLLAPMLYVDTLYSLAVDRRRQALHTAARSHRDRLCLLAENGFMLGYTGLGVLIFWRYCASANRVSTGHMIQEYRLYFTFQLLICALVVFVVVCASARFTRAPAGCHGPS